MATAKMRGDGLPGGGTGPDERHAAIADGRAGGRGLRWRGAAGQVTLGPDAGTGNSATRHPAIIC
jgi:hypothetical protein